MSLFQKDILLFAFLMSYSELDSELKCDMRQVEFFIKGSLTQESDIFKANKSNEEKMLIVEASGGNIQAELAQEEK